MILISDYQPAWRAEFLGVRELLSTHLGSLALRIDHIGSTSVPDLCAKDILDIQVSVAMLGAEIIGALSALGFVKHPDVNADHVPPGYLGAGEDWTKHFFMQPPGQRRMNVHVRRLGNPNQRYALLFRDYLVAHRDMAQAYGELKKRLARSLINDSDYPEVKDPAVDLIYFAAQQWASNTGWNAKASDA
jgi:GrpB-like predicted nucleotidyltransferase (UPF0157 family)